MEVMATIPKMAGDGKPLPGLRSLDFCCNIWMVGSEFDVEDMKSWTHPALCQWFRLLEVLWWGNMSSAPFRTPSAR